MFGIKKKYLEDANIQQEASLKKQEVPHKQRNNRNFTRKAF